MRYANTIVNILLLIFSIVIASSCQPPSRVSEVDKIVTMARNGNVSELKALVKPKMREIRDVDGDSLLAIAAYNHQAKVIDFLLSIGYSPDSHSLRGFTPLSIACQLNDTDIALALLNHSRDVNAAQFEGVTPIHYAVEAGNHKLTSALLAAGAKINLRTSHGETPLMYYLRLKNGYGRADVEFIKFLKKNGADVSVIDIRGNSALQWAISSKQSPEVLELLKSND